MTDLVMCLHDSREIVKESFVMSPHVMPHPIISQIVNENHKHEFEPQHEP